MFKKNGPKVLVGLLVLVLGILVSVFEKAGSAQDKEVVMTLRDYLVNSFLAELPEINKNLPSKIDDNTTLLSIDYSNGSVISRYELNGFFGDPYAIKNFGNRLGSVLKKQTCLDELKSKLLKVDVEFLGKYQDSKGVVMFEISVKNSDCTKLDLWKSNQHQ
jgi:hypothetical protein